MLGRLSPENHFAAQTELNLGEQQTRPVTVYTEAKDQFERRQRAAGAISHRGPPAATKRLEEFDPMTQHIQRLIENERPSEALALLDEHLRHVPKDPWAWYMRGCAHFAPGQYEQVIADCNAASGFEERDRMLASLMGAMHGMAQRNLGWPSW